LQGLNLIGLRRKKFSNKEIMMLSDAYKEIFKSENLTSNLNNLSEELKKNKGRTNLKFREIMSSKAFGLTAYYDSMIANWFNDKLNIEFPERKTIFGKKLKKLRYGENPHQQSSIYISSYDDRKLGFNQIHGKDLSYNNYNDIFAGLDILFSNLKSPSTVIIKHANPCGVASNKSAFQSFLKAHHWVY